MSCQVYRNKETKEIELVTASNGKKSNLYLKILERVKDKEKALKQWAVAYTGDWKGNVDINGEPFYDDFLKSKDLNIRDKYFKTKVVNHLDILNNIVENKHSLAPLAKKLINLSTKDIPIELVQDSFIKTKTVNAAGLYSKGRIKIAEYAKFRGRGSEATILHEILHAYTLEPLGVNRDARKELDEIYKVALENKDKFRNKYALTNLEEFIVGVYTDSQFIMDLQKIPSTNKFKNLYNELLDYFKKLFKFTSKESNLFEEAFLASEKVLDSYGEKRVEEKPVFILPIKDIEKDFKIRNSDGSRKRFIKQNTAINLARRLNKENSDFTFKSIKVLGEKGDSRTYWSVKATQNLYASPVEMSEEQSLDLEEEISNLDNTFEGLTYLQVNQVVSMVINHVNNEALKGKINLEESLQSLADNLTKDLNKYESMRNGDKKVERIIDVLTLNYKSTLSNFEQIAQIAVKSLNDDDKYKLSLEEVTDEKGEVYDIATYEVNPKSGVTPNMKRILSGFVREKKNFLNKKEFVPFDESFNTIAAILADTSNNKESVISRLEEFTDARPWLNQVVDKLNSLDKQMLNQFLSRMIMSKLDMKYTILKQVGNNTRLDVINTNRNDISKSIQKEWKQNIKTAGLYKPYQGTYKINKAELDKLKNLKASIENLDIIFKKFGINLNSKALDIIETKGIDGKSLKKIFTDTFGIVKILFRDASLDSTLEVKNPLNQSLIQKLAYLESRFNSDSFLTPNNFRTESKQIYSYINHTMVSDRVRKLKDQTKIKSLLSTQFTKHSKYLKLLDNNNTTKTAQEFRQRFNVFDSDLKSFETNLIGNKQKSGEFTSLSEAEIELAKLAYFGNSKFIDGNRSAKFVFPTMSDKTRVLIMEGISEDITGKNQAELVYERVVLPELERIMTHKDTGIKGYDTGAKLINFMPLLNSVVLNDKGVTVFEYLNTHKGKEGKELIKSKLLPEIQNYINSEVTRKNEKWKELDIVKYLPNKKLFTEEYVVNNLINTSEIYQLFIGDPAMFFKTKVTKDIMKYNTLEKSQQIKIAQDTFNNVNKRLSMLIAPGRKLADSDNNTYYQVMLSDRESKSVIYDYLKIILGDDVDAYGKMKGTDAQELTTWQEHLYVMEKMGDVSPFTTLEGDTITSEMIEEAREIFKSNKDLSTLNKSQSKLVNSLMQVMKPVYSGQVQQGDIQRVTYVKSSSYPLIPQLTKGLEIDKLRVSLEKFQETTYTTQNGLNGTVRASFETANKVGHISNALDIWNEDGSIKDITVDQLKESSIQLTRDNFRIQQDVPFKSGKKSKQDVVNIGTQERKLLFANLMSQKGFKYKGKEYNALELYDVYNDLYNDLFKLNLDNLFNELDIDGTKDISKQLDNEKLSKLLIKEAEERNYPLSDIKGLEVVDGKFKLPLWLHQSSDRYESLLNSIVANRVIGLKMPGYNYVLSTEEGFKDKKILEFEDINEDLKSQIIFTDNWEGELKPARFVLKSTGEVITKSIDSYKKSEIEFKASQIIAPMKFRDSKGNLINLMDGYVIKTDRGYRLDTSKFDKETLSLFGFRIPTSGLMSMASIEIVGFTPLNSGDILIASRDFTVQMGSDFDVDKITGYMYNTTVKDGKLIVDNTTEEKSLQNDIIELHHSIMSHKSDFTQSQIHRPLSFDYAEDIANEIDSKRNTGSNDYFTPLSDEYSKDLMISGSSGKAGCLGKGTKVLMYDGKFKKVEDIIVGDQLMGIDSTPRNVLQLCRGVEQMYWVNQNRGLNYRVNESHILSLKKKYPTKYSRHTKEGKRYFNYNKILHEKREETVNIKLDEYLNKNKNFKSTTRGYKSTGLNFPTKNINLDPYYVGLWLGDGSKRECDILHNLDLEVVNYLDKTFGIRYTYGLNNLSKVLNTENITKGFKIDFNSTRKGIDKKFIPDNYLYNNKKIRLQVLAGLIDSDGSYCKINKGYKITTNCFDLANQICFLTRSLGFYTYLAKVKGSTKIYPNGKEYTCTDFYNVCFVPESNIPVLIERKKQVKKSNFKNRLHTGITIKKDIVDNYYGFTLDKDHLFMLEDLTITHNTGVYSLDVVTHANLQVLKSKNTPVKLISKLGSYKLKVANIESHTELGRDKTVKPTKSKIALSYLEEINNLDQTLIEQLISNPSEGVKLFNQYYPGVIDKELSEFRYISDVLAEAQNYSVDNAKEAIMGKVNDNGVTFNARKVFNLLGIDKSFDKVLTDNGDIKRFSIPNLFMSQPILIDKVTPLMKAKGSSLAEFDSTPLFNISVQLEKELGVKLNTNLIENVSSQVLYDMLGKDIKDMSEHEKEIQLSILYKFIETDTIGTQLNSIQTSINTDSKKLGKSLFDNVNTLEKVIKLSDKKLMLGEDVYKFNNAELLLGEYGEGTKITPTLKIKPTSVNGYATVYGLGTAYNLYKKLFPYTSTTFDTQAKKLQEILGKKELTNTVRQDLLKALKSYNFASKDIQNLNQSISKERKELFIDGDTKSLASYIKDTLESNPKIKKYSIINSLNLEIESNGQPSLIKWNNSSTNDFEDQFYLSFLGMFKDTSSLPDYNGKPMTIQKLAQNLVTYSYLEGGIQKATQFIRHIPLEYLDVFGIADNLNNVNLNKLSSFGVDSTKLQDKYYVGDLVKQYIQHNPRKVSSTDELDDFFVLDEMGENFLHSFDKDLVQQGIKNSGVNLYQLLEGSKGLGYYKIPILGTTGMNEYNFDKSVNSLINRNEPKVDSQKSIEITPNKIPYIFNESSLDLIKQLDNPLAKEYVTLNKDIKFEISKGYKYEGAYGNDTIYISEGFLEQVKSGNKSIAYLERVILEEYTHAITKKALINPSSKQKDIVDKIIRYYKRAEKEIAKNYGQKALEDLKARFSNPSSPKSLSKTERKYIYGGINIVEFVGHIMTNPDFQEMLNKVTYEKEGRPESFWNKIKDLLVKLISNITNIPLKDNSLTTLAIAEVLDLVKVNNIKEESNKFISNYLVSKEKVLYEKLGTKTTSTNNVIIKPGIFQQNGVKLAKEIGGIFSMRVSNSSKHFGNPFSSIDRLVKSQNLIKAKNTKDSVEKYINWVLNSSEERANWIRNLIKSGDLKNKPIIYYKELNEPSHATALDYLINNYIEDVPFSPKDFNVSDFRSTLNESERKIFNRLKRDGIIKTKCK